MSSRVVGFCAMLASLAFCFAASANAETLSPAPVIDGSAALDGAASGLAASSDGAAPPIPFVASPDAPVPVVLASSPTPAPMGAGPGLQIQGLAGQTVPWSIIILLTG